MSAFISRTILLPLRTFLVFRRRAPRLGPLERHVLESRCPQQAKLWLQLKSASVHELAAGQGCRFTKSAPNPCNHQQQHAVAPAVRCTSSLGPPEGHGAVH